MHHDILNIYVLKKNIYIVTTITDTLIVEIKYGKAPGFQWSGW